MKLIGSRLEKDLEEGLRCCKKKLFSKEWELFRKELQKRDYNLKAAYMLNWIPEQGEDIMIFITDKKEIYQIEISRVEPNEPAIVERINFHEYKKSLRGKDDLLQLMIALKLIKEDQQNDLH